MFEHVNGFGCSEYALVLVGVVEPEPFGFLFDFGLDVLEFVLHVRETVASDVADDVDDVVSAYVEIRPVECRERAVGCGFDCAVVGNVQGVVLEQVVVV